jgi:hypothetical protein
MAAFVRKFLGCIVLEKKFDHIAKLSEALATMVEDGSRIRRENQTQAPSDQEAVRRRDAGSG